MTKELISMILSKKYKTLKNEGNKNNHIGVPLTLMNLNNKYDIAVIEMGMNHKGEISKLSNIVKPTTSVITNIGTAHIGNLGSQNNIFKAKKEILDGMKKGNLVITKNDKYLNKIKSKKIKILNSFDYKIISSDLNKTIFNINYNFKTYKFTLNVPGIHLVDNCAIAIRIGIMYGISMESMQKAIKKYKPLGSRLNIIKRNNNIIIDDCYNSNYESVIGLIDMLNKINKDKILILGDILELGKYSKKIHKKIGKKVSKEKYNKVYYIGKYMYYAHKQNKESIWFKNVDDFLKEKIIFNNSVIAIKGSRGIHLESIVNSLNM